MTVREFSNTVAQLLGTEREFSSVLPHDMPQEGYSRNQAQLVDPVFGRQLQYTAEQLALRLSRSAVGHRALFGHAGTRLREDVHS